MTVARVVLLALLLSALSLSGCVSDEEIADDQKDLMDQAKAQACLDKFCADAVVDETGRDLRVDLTANDTLDAPVWEVGDVFEQHVYYGSRDELGTHIKTMVVDDTGSCYQFGTTDKDAASYEATFDLPFLGCIDKDLTTSGFGEDWAWMYQFPLEDGKSWEGSWDWLYNWNSNVLMSDTFTLTASYDPKIDVQGSAFPGFVIVGVTPEGGEILRYNYVPAIGWFSHFWLYDLTTEDPTDEVLHMMSMGTSDRYTGPYFIDEAEYVLEGFSFPAGEAIGMALAGGPAPSEPVRQFDVAEGTTYLRGMIVPIACASTSNVVLNSPTNKAIQFDHTDSRTFDQCQGADESDPNLFTVHEYNEPAETGTYTFGGGGPGFAGWFAFLAAVTEVEYELTDDMLPAKTMVEA